MPKQSRKYPTKKKTTTKQGKREYQRLLMQDKRKEHRDLKRRIVQDKELMRRLRRDFPAVAKFIERKKRK